MAENLPFFVIVKWVMLLVPLAILLAWHHFQHQIYLRYEKQPSPQVFKELLNATRWRSVQVSCLWVLAVGVIAYQDIEDYRTPDAPAQHTQEAPLETLDFQQAPTAESAAPHTTTPPKNPTTEAVMDEIKFRYEDAFVSYFYLQRCKHADMADLALINESLAQEIARMGGDASVHSSVFSAAQGSFESIYADTPCDPAYLEPMVRQFEGFMQKIRQQ